MLVALAPEMGRGILGELPPVSALARYFVGSAVGASVVTGANITILQPLWCTMSVSPQRNCANSNLLVLREMSHRRGVRANSEKSNYRRIKCCSSKYQGPFVIIPHSTANGLKAKCMIWYSNIRV